MLDKDWPLEEERPMDFYIALAAKSGCCNCSSYCRRSRHCKRGGRDKINKCHIKLTTTEPYAWVGVVRPFGSFGQAQLATPGPLRVRQRGLSYKRS